MMINLEMQPDRPTDKDIEMHAEAALWEKLDCLKMYFFVLLFCVEQ